MRRHVAAGYVALVDHNWEEASRRVAGQLWVSEAPAEHRAFSIELYFVPDEGPTEVTFKHLSCHVYGWAVYTADDEQRIGGAEFLPAWPGHNLTLNFEPGAES